MELKNIKRALFLLVLIILLSCEDNGLFTDCADCTQNEPEVAKLQVELDPDYSSGAILIIYEGRMEDQILFDSIKVYVSMYERSVPINKTYTITATYVKNNQAYTTIDSATPRVKYTDDMCDQPCYYVYDRKYDLRLKYTK